MTKDSYQHTLDCLIVGDGCIGLFTAQALKRAQPELRIALKGRDGRGEHKQWLSELCRQHGIAHIHSFDTIDRQLTALIVCTKSDDLQQAAIDCHRAGIEAEQQLLIYNGMLPPLSPDFTGRGCRAITPAGYAFDRDDDSGLRVVNGELPWPICGDRADIAFWLDYLRGAQAAIADDSKGLVILRKYLINTAVNPLTVIYQRKVDELLDDKDSRARMAAILTETIALLRRDPRACEAMSAAPDDDILIGQSFDFIDSYRGHYTSAYHAYKAGQRVELASLTGFAIALGEQQGVSTPENDRVWREIQALQADF